VKIEDEEAEWTTREFTDIFLPNFMAGKKVR